MEHFEEKLVRNQAHQIEIKKQLDQLGWLRVLSFVLAIGTIVISNLYGYKIGYLIGAILLIGFIMLVRKYNKIDARKKYYEAKEKVLEEYKARIGETWKEFEENGESYIEELSRIKDLDLLGRSSLYQYICTAHTPFGKRALAKALTYGHKDKKTILKIQEAVKELIEDEDFALHLQTVSMQMGQTGDALKTESLESFMNEAEKQRGYVSKIMKGLALVLPFTVIFCLVIALLGFNARQNYIIAEIGVTVQLLITLSQAGSTSKLFEPIFEFNKSISAYKAFLIVQM